MKLFCLFIFLILLSTACDSYSTRAQIRASSNGRVVNSNANKKVEPPLDIASVDFKNFSFPDPLSVKADSVIALKNGHYTGGKTTGFRTYNLRKTYFFDITGDGNDEAVTQILVDGCGDGCDSHSLFFVHTVENNRLKLLWKMATGAEALGGLKSINFNNKRITLEVFGSCTLQDSRINAVYKEKNPNKILPTQYTIFVFALGDNGFAPLSNDVLPFEGKTIGGYRPQISFGAPQ